MVDDGLGADHVEQAADLLGSVVLVDVEGNRPRAEAAEHRLDVLGAVVEEQRDGRLPALPARELGTLAADAEAVSLEERREASGSRRDLRVRPPGALPDQHVAVGRGGGDRVVCGRQGPFERGHRCSVRPRRGRGTMKSSRSFSAPAADPAVEEDPVIRVIQWATGSVGRHALEAILAHPELELVGARVYSEKKAGRDVGELCGRGRTGVIATSSSDEVLALEADCVLYAAQGEMNPMLALDDICRLLASGKNVVSTAVTGLIYPKSLGQAVTARIEEACRTGGTSFHGTGIEPGWAAEVLPLTMSGLFRRIESIHVQELMDYSNYASSQMLIDIMGFGRAPDAQVALANPQLMGATFRAPLMLVADGLGAEIDDFVYTREVAVADRTFKVAAGEIREGTVSAQRFGFSAIIAGRRAITVEHITRLAADQAPDWPTGPRLAGPRRGHAVDEPGGHHRGERRGRERPGLPRHRDARDPRHSARL